MDQVRKYAPIVGTTIAIAAGFGTVGIGAGSAAAAIQSQIGLVSAGSAFATLQSLGMQGYFVGSFVVGSAITAVSSLLNMAHGSSNDSNVHNNNSSINEVHDEGLPSE
jgi:hypothetical protein